MIRNRPAALGLALDACLIVTAALLLARAGESALARGLAVADDAGDGGRLLLAVLSLAACATGVLTLQFPRRANVSLVLLPALLLWWQFDPALAAMLAGFGTLFGNAGRRAPVRLSLAGAATTLLAVWTGAWAAGAFVLGPAPVVAPFSLPWILAAAVFLVTASLADWGVDAVRRRLDTASARGEVRFTGRATFTGWSPDAGAPGMARVARMDPLVDVLLLPLAAAFEVVYLALGPERMSIVLGGMLVLLFVVRSLTNLRTAYGTLAEQRAKLATLFDQSGEGIYTVAGALRVETVNPTMAALLGVDAEELAGHACAQVCRFEDAYGQAICPERCPLVRAHAEQQPVTLEVLYPRPEEPPKHLLLTYASVGHAHEPLQLGIGIARDVTAQKEAEKLRDEFVSLVTHELRSPLTVSLGYIDLLKRLMRGGGDRAPDLAKGVYYAGRIEGAERHLLRLVNNLLEMARVERPDLVLELDWVDLDELLQEIVDGIRTVADEKQQVVTLSLPSYLPALWSSELYLREILSNLVSNAVKYTPDGGRVTVSASVVGDERRRTEDESPPGAPDSSFVLRPSLGGAWVAVTVSDTGYGMSPEEQTKLFSKFFRSGRPEIRKERGTGLGLALTKQMVERIGGSIDVESAVGQGSTFAVTIPLAAAPDSTPPSPPTSESLTVPAS